MVTLYTEHTGLNMIHLSRDDLMQLAKITVGMLDEPDANAVLIHVEKTVENDDSTCWWEITRGPNPEVIWDDGEIETVERHLKIVK